MRELRPGDLVLQSLPEQSSGPTYRLGRFKRHRDARKNEPVRSYPEAEEARPREQVYRTTEGRPERSPRSRNCSQRRRDPRRGQSLKEETKGKEVGRESEEKDSENRLRYRRIRGIDTMGERHKKHIQAAEARRQRSVKRGEGVCFTVVAFAGCRRAQLTRNGSSARTRRVPLARPGNRHARPAAYAPMRPHRTIETPPSTPPKLRMYSIRRLILWSIRSLPRAPPLLCQKASSARLPRINPLYREGPPFRLRRYQTPRRQRTRPTTFKNILSWRRGWSLRHIRGVHRRRLGLAVRAQWRSRLAIRLN